MLQVKRKSSFLIYLIDLQMRVVIIEKVIKYNFNGQWSYDFLKNKVKNHDLLVALANTNNMDYEHKVICVQEWTMTKY
jgi:hypothetical protein